jgi:ketosteroid isomerase-like protein
MTKAAVRSCCAIALTVAAACGWFDDDRAQITSQLKRFTEGVNTSAPEGLPSVTRAAELGSFFTDDVVVELGEGSAPIQGRETLIAMAARLQGRLAEFRLGFTDATVQVAPNKQSAEVTLTAQFNRRDSTARQQMDAREFKLLMRQEGGTWKIARATAVDTLK